MNHCPVYHAIGGHAYGWVYPGPMGAVLTPFSHRARRRRQFAECLDLLRALRGGLPDEDSAARHDAPLARAGIRAASLAGGTTLWDRLLGLFRQAALALSASDASRDGVPWHSSAGARGPCPSCPSARAGRRIAIFQARKARPSRRAGRRARKQRARVVSFARDDVLATIRRSLGVSGAEAPRRAEVEDRLSRAPRRHHPEALAGRAAPSALALFRRQAEEALATVTLVAGRRFGSGRGGPLLA